MKIYTDTVDHYRAGRVLETAGIVAKSQPCSVERSYAIASGRTFRRSSRRGKFRSEYPARPRPLYLTCRFWTNLEKKKPWSTAIFSNGHEWNCENVSWTLFTFLACVYSFVFIHGVFVAEKHLFTQTFLHVHGYCIRYCFVRWRLTCR